MNIPLNFVLIMYNNDNLNYIFEYNVHKYIDKFYIYHLYLKYKQNLPEPDYSEGIPIDEWMNSPNYTKPKTWEDVRREEQN